MDRFVMMWLVGLAMLSAFEPDWKQNRRSAWAQVVAMGGGLLLLGVYVCLR
jgi:hypothetical protein